MSAAAQPAGAVDPRPDRTTLVDVLDTLLATGVTVTGDVVLSVADVDLVHLGLRLVLRGLDGRAAGADPGAGAAPPDGGPAPQAGRAGLPPARPTRGDAVDGGADGRELDLGEVTAGELDRLVAAGRRGDADPEDVQRGLAALVLTLVEVLRELMERQAVRRMGSGTLHDDETERLGRTFLALRERMEELKEVFGLTDADLDLDLGPLGHLR